MQKRPLMSWKHIKSAPFRAETPSPFPNSVKSTPASIGDSATMDIHIQSQTIIVLSTISKMGRLTIPISGSHHGIINTILRIPLQRLI